MENREKYLEQQIEEIQKEQSNNIVDSKKKRKKLFTRIGAAIIAVAIGITGIVHIFKRNKNNSKTNQPTLSTVDTTPTINPEDQININGLGLVYENPTLEIEKPVYGNTTGDVKKEDLVEKNDTVWKDKEAADNSSNVGKTEVDDKNGKLEVKPNGNVTEKEEGYEIKKEDGTVIEGTITEENKQNGEVGSNGTILPPGYVHDENLNKDVVEEDANKFVYSDADYYDPTGQLIYSKGELISKEDLEMAKQLLTTTKPVVETKPAETVPAETKPAETVPAETKPVETVPAETKPAETVPVETKPAETVPVETKPVETVPEETFVPTQGTVNADGTYTIDGITFETKADYEQWVIQGYEGYGIDLDGIMKPEEEIKENYNKRSK